MPLTHFKDISGERFGRLVVLSSVPTPAGKVGAHWLCRCDCGAEKIVRGNSLRSGHTQSCGCRQRELPRPGRQPRHGMARPGQRTKEYRAWLGMRDRCRNQRSPDYPRYGARGIQVCERWDAFEVFLSDMGPAPSPQHSLDRINNDGNYEPGNVRWATATQQGRNMSNNRRVSMDGRTQTLMDWSEEYNIDFYTLHARLRRGWSLERALTTPIPSRTGHEPSSAS